MFYSNEYMISVETESTVPMQDLRDALQQACDAGAEFQFRILTTQAPSFIVLFWRDASEDEEYIAKRMTAADEESLATAAFQQLADELAEPGIDMLADLVQQLAEGRAEFIQFGSLDEVKPSPEEEGAVPDTSGVTSRSGDGQDRGRDQAITFTQETIVDAAYLMQGYRSKHGTGLQISDPSSSELDTVTGLVAWAPKLNDIYSQLARLDIYPTGVFAYEVAEELGAAIGDMVKATGVWPEDQEIWAVALPLFRACYCHEDMLTDVQLKFDFTLQRASGIKTVSDADKSGPHAEHKAAESGPSFPSLGKINPANNLRFLEGPEVLKNVKNMANGHTGGLYMVVVRSLGVSMESIMVELRGIALAHGFDAKGDITIGDWQPHGADAVTNAVWFHEHLGAKV